MAWRDSLYRFGQRFRAASERLGQRVQHVVVSTILFFVYFLGLGLTRLIASVCARKFLTLYKVDPDSETCWIDAQGYEPDPQKLLRQM